MQASISKKSIKARTFSHLFFILWCWSVTMLTACQKEELAQRDYPRLKTLEAVVESNSRVTFHAEIISGNLDEIIEYGFVWGTIITPQIEYQDKYSISGPASGSHFSQQVSITFQDDKTMYVRPYLKTPNYLVYGKTISFSRVSGQ